VPLVLGVRLGRDKRRYSATKVPACGKSRSKPQSFFHRADLSAGLIPPAYTLA